LILILDLGMSSRKVPARLLKMQRKRSENNKIMRRNNIILIKGATGDFHI
jgi:hypothetical protein